MSSQKKYTDYCVGCGLCKSEFKSKKYKEKGFNNFNISNVDKNYLKNICPISGNSDRYYKESVWGNLKSIYYGYSTDKNIRYKASSGGVITTLSIYLLEKKKVDGIIQIRRKEDNPIETEVVLNTTRKDVIKCVGSRYSNSSVLENLSEMIDPKKKYALIGRPCDILILKNFQKEYKKYENIVYTIAFFCAGNPSDYANQKLLKDMGIKDISKCKKMDYRGNGWPGYATAIDVKDKVYKMRYAESWGNYLGRDIRLMCKFCIDGCGAAADISCGDAWYLNENDWPIFDENEGRNLIFARTENGDKIIQEAYKDKYIELEKFKEGEDTLRKIQPAQFERTTTMISKILAFKLFLKKTPNYHLLVLKKLSRKNKIRIKLRFFKGTISRIINKKI